MTGIRDKIRTVLDIEEHTPEQRQRAKRQAKILLGALLAASIGLVLIAADPIKGIIYVVGLWIVCGFFAVLVLSGFLVSRKAYREIKRRTA